MTMYMYRARSGTHAEETQHLGVFVAQALTRHHVQDVASLVVQLRRHETSVADEETHERRVRLLRVTRLITRTFTMYFK